MGEESYYPKSCKSLPDGTKVILNSLGANTYESNAIRHGLKDNLAEALKGYLDSHFVFCIGENCRKQLNFEVDLASFSYDLNEDGVDEVFTEFDAPGYCGSSGCSVYLIQKLNGKWTIGLEDKRIVSSSSTMVIVDEKINGYKVIYAKGRDYGTQDPEECPYASNKCTYDKKIQTYKCKEY